MCMEMDRRDELGRSSSIGAGDMAIYTVMKLHGAESRMEEETAESIIITCLQNAHPSSSRAATRNSKSCPVLMSTSPHDGRAGELHLSATARHRDLMSRGTGAVKHRDTSQSHRHKATDATASESADAHCTLSVSQNPISSALMS
jgi:hypothetical protein